MLLVIPGLYFFSVFPILVVSLLFYKRNEKKFMLITGISSIVFMFLIISQFNLIKMIKYKIYGESQIFYTLLLLYFLISSLCLFIYLFTTKRYISYIPIVLYFIPFIYYLVVKP